MVIGLPINNKTSDNFLHGLSDEFVAKCFYFSAKKRNKVCLGDNTHSKLVFSCNINFENLKFSL